MTTIPDKRANAAAATAAFLVFIALSSFKGHISTRRHAWECSVQRGAGGICNQPWSVGWLSQVVRSLGVSQIIPAPTKAKPIAAYGDTSRPVVCGKANSERPLITPATRVRDIDGALDRFTLIINNDAQNIAVQMMKKMGIQRMRLMGSVPDHWPSLLLPTIIANTVTAGMPYPAQ